MCMRDLLVIPYSGKLSRQKTFANWWKIQSLHRKLLRIARFCCAKGHYAPNFVEKTFTDSHKTVKFAEVFSLKSFPLYGTLSKNLTVIIERQHQYSSLLGRFNAKFELQRMGTAPLTSTLMSTWRHVCDSFSQAFPFHFCVLQAIKNWRWERPGNEATSRPSITVCQGLPKSISLESFYTAHYVV